MSPSGVETKPIEAARGPALTPRAVTPVHALGGPRPWARQSDVSTAEQLAKFTRASAEDILQMRREGQSWGTIKRALGISLPEVPPDDSSAPHNRGRGPTRLDVLA